MDSLLSKLSKRSNQVAIEPRDIFMSLPQKDKQYEYPRDVQSEVWKKWFEIRNHENCIIKMNTGSGKTIVGLLILQSCLNEGKGPAIYVVPDKYLATQVCNEAKRIGIQTTEDKEDYAYTENKAILVTNIYSLFNGHTVFGMRKNGNYPIGSVLIDDVHACIDTINIQFSIKIPKTHDLYKQIVNIFSSQWKDYNTNSYNNIIENCDSSTSVIVPFWIWQEKQAEVYKALLKYNNDNSNNNFIYFNLPLIGDHFDLCDCFISSNKIEIIPDGIDVSKIQSFINAKRKIFMSATLSDDSVFVSTIGLHKENINRIIVPDRANDVGDRLFLFPRHLNSAISNEEIRKKIKSISEDYNVVVIVPSFEKAKLWDPEEKLTADKSSIENIVSSLKNRNAGLTIFVNRYDGIDLPDDACRVLVIDGLPPLRNEKDKYIQNLDPSSGILIKDQMQRIEQGIGRGVRSNSDSCCIVLMGDDLANALLRNNGVSFFSNATREQYNLSKELWSLLKQEIPKPSLENIFELASYSLNRNLEWIQTSKERLSEIEYSDVPIFDETLVALRKAYDFALVVQWQKAIDVLDVEINKEADCNVKGFLMQIKAKYMNFIDKSKSQQILLSGKSVNARIVSPINGIKYNKTINKNKQAYLICKEMNKYQNPNDFVMYANSITASLDFLNDTYTFENAIQLAGTLLGFQSSRPDKETNGEGPDNLWAINDDLYLVIECKSGANATTISKDYCNQLGGSIRWFAKEYGSNFTAIPIMIHKANIIDKQATAVENMRVTTQKEMEKLRKNINDFAAAVSYDNNWCNENKINELLVCYNLRGCDIVENYSHSIQTK